MYSAPSCMFRFSAAMEGSAIQSWMRLIEASRAASAAFRTSGYRSLAAQAAEPKNMEPAPASPAAARNSRRSRPPGVRFDSVIICSSLGPVRLDRDDQAGTFCHPGRQFTYIPGIPAHYFRYRSNPVSEGRSCFPYLLPFFAVSRDLARNATTMMPESPAGTRGRHFARYNMNDKKSYDGRCFCGQVQLTVTGEPVGMGYCHCDSCRHWSAGPVNAFTLWKPESVKITQGEGKLKSWSKTPASIRKWCENCG